VKNYNALAHAIATAMSHDRPLELTLTDGRSLTGRIERREATRQGLLITVEGHDPVRLTDVDAARWA